MTKRGDTIEGPFRCDSCWKATGVIVYYMWWTYVGEQQISLDGKRWATLANCPRCHSTSVVREVRK